MWRRGSPRCEGVPTGTAGVPISEFPHVGTARPGAIEVRIWYIEFIEVLIFFLR